MTALRHAWCAALVAGALTFAAVAAQAAPIDPLLDHMTGHWVLTGTIAGQRTTHDIDAGWILQNTYIRLTEVSREKDAAGKPQYEAEVLLGYDAAKKRYVCFWYDITGVASPDAGGIAKREGDTLPFVFKSPEGDFQTTMAYDAKSDSWQWGMDMEQGGKLEPFARVTLTRPK
jgi:hypothetical protein